MTTPEAIALYRAEREAAVKRGADLLPRTGRINLAFRSSVIDLTDTARLRKDAFIVHAVASDWGN